jgi:hypothetical protein
MIIGTVTVTRSMVLAALAVVSFLIAIVDLLAGLGTGLPAPGFLLAVTITSSRAHDLSDLLGVLALWVLIDWIFWFAVMCGIYFLVVKLRGSSSGG